MKSEDLTPAQLQRISRWMIPPLRLLTELHERMKARSFPKDDPFMQSVSLALETFRDMRSKFHTLELYANPDSPTWLRKPRKSD